MFRCPYTIPFLIIQNFLVFIQQHYNRRRPNIIKHGHFFYHLWLEADIR